MEIKRNIRIISGSVVTLAMICAVLIHPVSARSEVDNVATNETTTVAKTVTKTTTKATVKTKKSNEATKIKWNGPVQASYYTLAENGPITASGYRMTESSLGVAVPMQTVVSKKAWKRGSASFKKTHFYYGEKIKLKHGKYTCTARVVDCGGFGSCGCYYKGKWRKRLFDLQPAVKRKLHCGDVGIVKWAYTNTN